MVSITIPLCAGRWKLPANGEDLFLFWIEGLGRNLHRRGLDERDNSEATGVEIADRFAIADCSPRGSREERGAAFGDPH
jgi:hypothetical protein